MKTNKQLNKELRENAVSCGLCHQWKSDWKKDWSLETMIAQFYRGMDFFIKNRFISNDFIKESFDLTFRRDNGVLVDDKYSLLSPMNAILLGNSESVIRFNSYDVCTMYVLDDSCVKIIAKGNAFVLVHAYGNAQLGIEQKDKASVAVIKHSNGCVVISDDDITVKEANSNNYS